MRREAGFGLPEQVERPALLTTGDLQVADGATVRETIRAAGKLVVGAGSIVEASAEAGESAEVREGARIEGALRVNGPVWWGAHAEAQRAAVNGPLMTEGSFVRATAVFATRGIHAALQRGVVP